MPNDFFMNHTSNCSLELAKQKIRQIPFEDRLDIPFETGRAGQDTFFTQLYLKYYQSAIQIVGSFEKDCMDAEDIVQELFIRLFNQPEKLQTIESFDKFIYVSLRNAVLNYKAKQKTHRNFVLNYALLNEPGERYSPDENIIYQNTLSVINKSLHALSPQRREAFRLRKLKGHSLDEVSRIMGIHKKTVHHHLQVAKKSIKHSLESQCA